MKLNETNIRIMDMKWNENIKSWINEKKVMSNNSKIIEIPRYRSIDIDNMDDWKEAEYKFKNLNK